MERARRARAIIKYVGMDITEAVSRGLLSLTYTDNTEKGDDIQIKVEDIDGNWMGPWYPKVAAQKTESSSTDTAADYSVDLDSWEDDLLDIAPQIAALSPPATQNDFSDITVDAVPASSGAAKTNSAATPYAATGTILEVTIVTESWDNPGTLETLSCGSFEVDGFQIHGPPSTATISGVSIPLTSSIRREEHSQGWEDTTLQQVAQDICGNAGLKLVYELEDDPKLDRTDQWHEPDLPYLQTLCQDHGVSLKVYDNQVVLFSEAGYEARDPVVTFRRGDGRLLGYTFTQDSQGTASSAAIAYKDPKSGKLVTEEFAPENAPAVGQELHANLRPSDLAGDYFRESSPGGRVEPIEDFEDIRVDAKGTALTKGKAMLRAANRGEWKCELRAVGDVRMRSGVTFLVAGFGVFDGKYIVESAAHTLDSGYTMKISGHRVLEGY